MKIIISPAKKMQKDTEAFRYKTMPFFKDEAELISKKLKSCSRDELKEIWKCSDKLLEDNAARLSEMDLDSNVSAAISTYEGIQYQYMSPKTMEKKELEYLDRHLRILSGLYGVVRPFDGIAEYRLEMQARFGMKDKKNLYELWGSRLYERLLEEELGEGEAGLTIVNLASEEYSKAVLPYIKAGDRCVNISFLKETDKGLKKQATLQKMARGEMVRFMAEHDIRDPEELKKFDRSGFEFCSEMSDGTDLIFIKKNNDIKDEDYSWK